MKRSLFFILLFCLAESKVTFAGEHVQLFKLPEPETRGDISIEQAIGKRRSLRDFSGSLALADVAQLLWAAQGETHPDGYRATPSAGALYPLEVYLVVGNVRTRFDPAGNSGFTQRIGLSGAWPVFYADCRGCARHYSCV